ncbi:hypothetical protein Hanom_Chr12g01141651 [Helianthus anomalus]
MPKERKYKRRFQYFTYHPSKSLGDILSWGYLEDLQVWDVEELVQIKNIKQFYYGLDVKMHDQKLELHKAPSQEKFPDWKPHYPEQVVIYDPITGEKDITLKIKPPRCVQNMPLRAMEQDFHEDFKGWLYNQSTTEIVISLYDKKTGETRRINVLDPMWLVNCSKKDIDCLFFNKIVYEGPDRAQAQQHQKCEKFKKIRERAAVLGRRKFERPLPTDQTPIESEENKIPRWDRKRDGDQDYRKYWKEIGRPLR